MSPEGPAAGEARPPTATAQPQGSAPLLHVVPGPDQHGVARHGLRIHQELTGVQGLVDTQGLADTQELSGTQGLTGSGEQPAGQPPELLRCDRLDELPDAALAGRVAVVQVTDRVLAGNPGAALAAWRRVTAGAARLTVVLHDLPQRSDGDGRRARSHLYAALACDADEIVVASHHERLLLAAVLRWARPRSAAAVLGRTHVIPLPVEQRPTSGERPTTGHRPTTGQRPSTGQGPTTGQRPTTGHRPSTGQRPTTSGPPASPDDVLTVVTLGFVYPGKGLEEVVDAAAAAARDPRLAGRRVEVRNLGRASDGHEDLLEELATRAEAAGIGWSTSGWVDDVDLPALLAAATVPVAAHRHLSASGSIATWLGAGRRPVVLPSRYAAELEARNPGALTVVGRLTAAITTALLDPASTWLPADLGLTPSWADAAARLQEVASRPAVSVVVPYYRDQELLDLILDRLAAQQGVLGGLEVVVADDGSPQPPTATAAGAVDRVTVVRQDRDGFRAAAARNLGARSAQGRVLLFVDGDTVPEDGYAAALQRACLTSPTLAVGRRRHAELRELARAETWPPVDELPAPGWLADGYRGTRDLADADDSAFRWIISAVMGVSRQVWDVVGGFDERLTGYGGEDWELGWRCWLAGADLRHVPDAVAWHDGPDLAGRPEGQDAARLAEVKNAETARLAPLLPHPLVRGRGWTHAQPDVVAVLHTAGWSPGQVTVVAESLLRQGDVGVWLLGQGHAGGRAPDPAGAPTGGGLPGPRTTSHHPVPAADPRVHTGHPPSEVLARARALLEVTRPVAVHRLPWAPWPQDLSATLTGSPEVTGDPASGVRVAGTRHTGRSSLHGEDVPPAWLPAAWVDEVEEHALVERWRQR